ARDREDRALVRADPDLGVAVLDDLARDAATRRERDHVGAGGRGESEAERGPPEKRRSETRPETAHVPTPSTARMLSVPDDRLSCFCQSRTGPRGPWASLLQGRHDPGSGARHD